MTYVCEYMAHGPSSVRSTKAKMDIKGKLGYAIDGNKAALRQHM